MANAMDLAYTSANERRRKEMKTSIVLIAGLLATGVCTAQTGDSDAVIAAAVAPLPEEYRADATVMAYDADGELSVVREGSNEMICLADEPGDERFHAACYHASLEPFMERGRVLRKEGKSRDEVRNLREEEARAGDLTMPDRPAALYSLTGSADAFDPATGTVTGASPLYVVYLPYATEAETGLSTIPAPGKPWLMDAGKPWAHIMLMPPDEEE